MVPVAIGGNHELFFGRTIVVRVLPPVSALELAGVAAPPEPGTQDERDAVRRVLGGIAASRGIAGGGRARRRGTAAGDAKRMTWLTTLLPLTGQPCEPHPDGGCGGPPVIGVEAGPGAIGAGAGQPGPPGPIERRSLGLHLDPDPADPAGERVVQRTHQRGHDPADPAVEHDREHEQHEHPHDAAGHDARASGILARHEGHERERHREQEPDHEHDDRVQRGDDVGGAHGVEPRDGDPVHPRSPRCMALAPVEGRVHHVLRGACLGRSRRSTASHSTPPFTA